MQQYGIQAVVIYSPGGGEPADSQLKRGSASNAE